VLFITTTTLSIINPWFLIAVALLLGISGFLIVNKDPIKVGEGDFLKMTVLARLYIVFGIILYSSFGGIAFLISIAVSTIVCVIHAVLCDIEATRDIKTITGTLKGGQAQDFHAIVNRAYELLCLAIGLKESNEVYNMASVPGFVAKEIKQDLKDIKNSVKNLFKD
jgi:cytochrome b subunit of formate dehydrogenase